MKEKMIEIIRQVPIAKMTYPEYVEAIADRLIDEGVTLKEKPKSNDKRRD